MNQQLKGLEHDGILRKEVFKELPPRVEYTPDTTR
ncbi:winged helix-turn-helix transcriptional regulator [Sphingobacterium sp. ML3W]|nr:winged helix-turn-helix transcriptional regulator [Sphingobacterium sp. ML3W]WFA80493.1 winged helix-turn-helix transcriptional regulator [Sphingobacterium sp. ML3W]